jgi:hypothetical protein
MKLKPILLTSLICLLSTNAFAETAAPAAAGAATGLCKDDTLYTGSTKKGACKGHKGIKEWYADKQTPAASTPATAPAASTATPTPSPAIAASPAPANAPATGLCKDDTQYTGATKKGACKGHKGIKEWYADKQTPAASTPVTAPAAPNATATTPPATPAPAPVKPAAPVAEPAKVATPAPATTPPTATAPAAVGTGKVWVNTRSKIYHCEGTKFYGKTKDGEYMTQEEAKAKGYNANRKKDCK